MKTPYNAFKAARLQNAIRVLILVCVAGIVLVLLMYLSVGSNRKQLAQWFGISRPQINSQQNTNIQTDAGLPDSASVNTSVQVRPLDRDDHLWGPIDAPVSIIVYDDFECPFCAQLYETINRAKEEFGNRIVIAVRHFPLISHEQAIPAAEVAECAGEQSKFWEMYHLLYADNKSGLLSAERYQEHAKELNLDSVEFNNCLTKEKYKDKILSQKEEVKNLGVIGTPASFINTQYIPGALPYEDFTYPDGSAALGMRSLIQKKLNDAR